MNSKPLPQNSHNPRLVLCAFLMMLASLTLLSAQEKAPLYECTFEGMKPTIPNWGGGYQGVYKGIISWKEPFAGKLDKSDPHSGDACLQIEYVGESEGTMLVHSPTIAIPDSLKGKKIRLMVFVRSTNLQPDSVSLTILEKGSDGSPVGYFQGSPKLVPVPDSTHWQKLTAEGNLNPRTGNIVLVFSAEPSASGGTLWVDDILALPVSTAE